MTTIASICNHFERASAKKIDAEVLAAVQANGRIILSIDGAQPEKGKPALWLFLDLLTGHVLHAAVLSSAPWEVLLDIMRSIEKKYGVQIVAVMSDKQKNIVKAVSKFRRGIPHAFCHYHFLSHVAEPIAAKDSQLQVSLRSSVRRLSVVKTVEKWRPGGRPPAASSVAATFKPLVSELLRSISCTGDRITTFPGLETFRNLEHVLNQLKQIEPGITDGVHKRTLKALMSRLSHLLDQNRNLVSEIESLRADFDELRGILGRRCDSPDRVRRSVDGWCNKLKKRLQRRGLEHRASKIKWQRATSDMPVPQAWQQWLRLVASYNDGLYHGYKIKERGFTNNEMERRIGRLKSRGRGLLGRKNVGSFIMNHGEYYSRLESFDFDSDCIHEVLLMVQRGFSPGGVGAWRLVGLEAHPDWRVREHDVGNLSMFEVLLSCSR